MKGLLKLTDIKVTVNRVYLHRVEKKKLLVFLLLLVKLSNLKIVIFTLPNQNLH